MFTSEFVLLEYTFRYGHKKYKIQPMPKITPPIQNRRFATCFNSHDQKWAITVQSRKG